jgi:hypothetical protein
MIHRFLFTLMSMFVAVPAMAAPTYYVVESRFVALSSATRTKLSDHSALTATAHGGILSPAGNGSQLTGIAQSQVAGLTTSSVPVHAGLSVVTSSADAKTSYSNGTISGYTGIDNGAGRLDIGTTSNHPVGIETNGTTRVTVLPNGTVGIGTNNPTTGLHVTGAYPVGYAIIERTGTNGSGMGSVIQLLNSAKTTGDGLTLALSLRNSADVATAYGSVNTLITSPTSGSETGALSLSTRNTALGGMLERMKISETGNVGIGTPAPVGKLNISSAAGDNLIYADNFSATTGNTNYWFSRKSHTNTGGSLVETVDGDYLGTFYFQGVSVGGAYQFGAKLNVVQNGAAGVYVPANMTLSTYSATGANSNQLLLSSAGNVGIGTPNPLTKFEVMTDSTHHIQFGQAVSVGGGEYAGGLYWIGNKLTLQSFLHGTNYQDVIINPNAVGNVGIGTTAPGAKFQVQGSGIGTGEALTVTDSTGVSKKLVVLDNGNVGVGTAAPASPLHVAGTTTGSEVIIAGTVNSTSYAFGTNMQTVVNSTTNHVYGWYNNPTLAAPDGKNAANFALQGQINVGTGLTTPFANQIDVGNVVKSGSGTITNAVGIFLRDQTSGTNNFGIYQAGSNINYFGGNVGIGTTTPTTQLDVSGNSIRIRTTKTPTSSADASGNVGDLGWDDNYTYVKTSSGWKRSALSTF